VVCFLMNFPFLYALLLTFLLHALPISFSLALSFRLCLAKRTSYEAFGLLYGRRPENQRRNCTCLTLGPNRQVYWNLVYWFELYWGLLHENIGKLSSSPIHSQPPMEIPVPGALIPEGRILYASQPVYILWRRKEILHILRTEPRVFRSFPTTST
jgi:hypothetical protein